MNLFVYGTLLFPEIRQLVGGRSFDFQPAIVKGFEIRVVKGASFPGVFRSDAADAQVEGEILFGISEVEAARFDRYEDAFYQRVSVEAVRFVGEQTVFEPVELYEVPVAEAEHILSPDIWTKDWFQANHYEAFLNLIQS